MNITDVRVNLESHRTLRAYCTVAIDGEFVLDDIKIVEKGGRLIVAMPSKKRTTPCSSSTCRSPCPITEEFCPACGLSQGPQAPRVEQLRAYIGCKPEDLVPFYRDLFHPITRECRAQVERAVLEAYRRELAKLPRASDTQADAGAAVESADQGGTVAGQRDRAAGGGECVSGQGQG